MYAEAEGNDDGGAIVDCELPETPTPISYLDTVDAVLHIYVCIFIPHSVYSTYISYTSSAPTNHRISLLRTILCLVLLTKEDRHALMPSTSISTSTSTASR